MTTQPISELREAYDHFSRVSDECAASADYNAFADLFTTDCTYIEHVFGEMLGREAVREWIVPLMKMYPNDQMTYTHDWVLFDAENGRVIFCARTHMPDLGDGRAYSTTNWSMIDYAGDGLFSREEDIYNPAHFGTLLADWRRAKDAAGIA
jgi:SnoaL-like domain